MSKKAAKKQSILQAAIEVFSNRGFKNSCISEIAKRANVAEGTIYQYFKNKEDLFFSIPVEKTIEFCEELDLHLQGITDPFSKIRKFIWYYLYHLKKNSDYARTLLLEMRVNRSLIETKAYSSFKQFTREILEILQEGQEEGVVRKDVNLYVLRQMILGILEHAVTRWLLKEQKYDLMGYYEDISKLVVSALSCPREIQEPNTSSLSPASSLNPEKRREF